MRGFLLIGAIVGIAYGVVGKRMHYAWKDHLSAQARFKGAKRERRRAALWSAGAVVVAVLVVRALMV